MVTETCYDPQMIWSSKTKMEDHKKEKHSDLQTCDKIQTVCICCCGMIKTNAFFSYLQLYPWWQFLAYWWCYLPALSMDSEQPARCCLSLQTTFPDRVFWVHFPMTDLWQTSVHTSGTGWVWMPEVPSLPTLRIHISFSRYIPICSVQLVGICQRWLYDLLWKIDSLWLWASPIFTTCLLSGLSHQVADRAQTNGALAELLCKIEPEL